MEFFGMSRQGRMVATIFQAEMLPFFTLHVLIMPIGIVTDKKGLNDASNFLSLLIPNSP